MARASDLQTVADHWSLFERTIPPGTDPEVIAMVRRGYFMGGNAVMHLVRKASADKVNGPAVLRAIAGELHEVVVDAMKVEQTARDAVAKAQRGTTR